jgi:hypothetical protein
MRSIPFGPGLAGLMLMTATASAQSPAAIVEDVSGGAAGIEFMDYVAAGKVIKLGGGGKLVLGYLKSCWRETISGGTVTIGDEQSDIKGGTAERTKVACEAAKMQMTATLASKSGAMAFRGQNERPIGRLAKPNFILYGQAPLVEVTKGSTVVIERVDKTGERYEITGDGVKLVRGVFYDFAQDNKNLVPAGLYTATSGSVKVLFQVDPDAQPGRTPAAGRLIRLQPAG